jgi:hypothetical protein
VSPIKLRNARQVKRCVHGRVVAGGDGVDASAPHRVTINDNETQKTMRGNKREELRLQGYIVP